MNEAKLLKNVRKMEILMAPVSASTGLSLGVKIRKNNEDENTELRYVHKQRLNEITEIEEVEGGYKRMLPAFKMLCAERGFSTVEDIVHMRTDYQADSPKPYSHTWEADFLI